MIADADIDRARSTPIEHVIDQRGIKLRGRVERVGPCPRCGGTDRFAINIRKQVFNCRACATGGDVIALVQHLDGCGFIDACRMLADDPAAPERNGSKPQPLSPTRRAADPAALKLWHDAELITGTVAHKYLRGRGITIEPPVSLRCGVRPHLGIPMDAMVAAISRPDHKVVAVQSTALTENGLKASSSPRITNGAPGNCAVRLAAAGAVLGIAEGVESALSAMQLTNVPTWACLGAQRMCRVAIPDHVRELHIFADNDEAGRAAVERTVHQHQHRKVLVRFPPDGVKDWNDALQAARI